ncbi:MAG: hypothetical protein V3W18_04030 [candidate division Zixibacteria bacterium]
MVLFPIDIDGETGEDLGKVYKIGATFPVFILANGEGEVFSQWIGYTGSDRFDRSLKKAKSDLTTIKARISRFKTNPTLKDATFMARYCTETREFLDAASYFRKAEELGNREYSYDIFKSTANAIWIDLAEFESVFPTADAVLNSKIKNNTNIIGTARSLARLVRKKGQTDKISKYLRAGVEAASNSRNPKDAKNLTDLQAEYALYADRDTSMAIEIKRNSLGRDWPNKPEKYYNFSKWCVERLINLEEAEYYARKAVKLAMGEEFGAKTRNTLAEIVYARGNINEAISLMEEVIHLNPEEDKYYEKLLQYKNESTD